MLKCTHCDKPPILGFASYFCNNGGGVKTEYSCGLMPMPREWLVQWREAWIPLATFIGKNGPKIPELMEKSRDRAVKDEKMLRQLLCSPCKEHIRSVESEIHSQFSSKYLQSL